MKTLVLLSLLFVGTFALFGDIRSSHSEAPGTAKIPNADITDFYAFKSYEAGKQPYVVFLMNSIPLQNPNAGPNYYTPSDRHFFEINVDNDGDCVEDLIIQWYNGNSLGGDIENITQVDEDPCGNGTLLSVTAHSGIKVPVKNPGDDPSTWHNISVALKVVGPIDAFEDNDPSLNWREWYQMNLVRGARATGSVTPIQSVAGAVQFPKPFDYAGQKSFGTTADYADYATGPSSPFIITLEIPGCTPAGGAYAARVFVGQRKESFSIALGKIFDLINFIPVELGTFGAANPNVGVAQCPEHNELDRHNVLTYALEIHQDCLLGTGGDTIGVWGTTRELLHVGTSHNPGKQVSRLGNPLVNELVIGLNDKAKFNIGHPTGDTQFIDYVLYPTMPVIVDVLFLTAVNGLLTTPVASLAPLVPRNDLVAVFLTGVTGLNQIPASTACEYMRLNTSITPTTPQDSMGVINGDAAGFPNGRRPGDDVVDIALRVMLGRLCYLPTPLCNTTDAPLGAVNYTDGSPISVNDFEVTFPFLKTPNPGSVAYANAAACAGDGGDGTTDGGDGTTGDGGDGNNCPDAASVISSWLSYLF